MSYTNGGGTRTNPAIGLRQRRRFAGPGWVGLHQNPGKRTSDQSEAKKVTAVCVNAISSHSRMGRSVKMEMKRAF